MLYCYIFQTILLSSIYLPTSNAPPSLRPKLWGQHLTHQPDWKASVGLETCGCSPTCWYAVGIRRVSLQALPASSSVQGVTCAEPGQRTYFFSGACTLITDCCCCTLNLSVDNSKGSFQIGEKQRKSRQLKIFFFGSEIYDIIYSGRTWVSTVPKVNQTMLAG